MKLSRSTIVVVLLVVLCSCTTEARLYRHRRDVLKPTTTDGDTDGGSQQDDPTTTTPTNDPMNDDEMEPEEDPEEGSEVIDPVASPSSSRPTVHHFRPYNRRQLSVSRPFGTTRSAQINRRGNFRRQYPLTYYSTYNRRNEASTNRERISGQSGNHGSLLRGSGLISPFNQGSTTPSGSSFPQKIRNVYGSRISQGGFPSQESTGRIDSSILHGSTINHGPQDFHDSPITQTSPVPQTSPTPPTSLASPPLIDLRSNPSPTSHNIFGTHNQPFFRENIPLVQNVNPFTTRDGSLFNRNDFISGNDLQSSSSSNSLINHIPTFDRPGPPFGNQGTSTHPVHPFVNYNRYLGGTGEPTAHIFYNNQIHPINQIPQFANIGEGLNRNAVNFNQIRYFGDRNGPSANHNSIFITSHGPLSNDGGSFAHAINPRITNEAAVNNDQGFINPHHPLINQDQSIFTDDESDVDREESFHNRDMPYGYGSHSFLNSDEPLVNASNNVNIFTSPFANPSTNQNVPSFIVPNVNTMLPYDQRIYGSHSVYNQQYPFGDNNELSRFTPSFNGDSTFVNHPSPVIDHYVPFTNQNRPSINRITTFVNQNTPSANYYSPFANQNTPSTNPFTPFANQNTLYANHVTPFVNQDMSFASRLTPFVNRESLYTNYNGPYPSTPVVDDLANRLTPMPTGDPTVFDRDSTTGNRDQNRGSYESYGGSYYRNLHNYGK